MSIIRTKTPFRIALLITLSIFCAFSKSVATHNVSLDSHTTVYLDGIPVRLSILKSTVRTGTAVGEDRNAIARFVNRGGILEYYTPQNPTGSLDSRKATGLKATITVGVVNDRDVGACAYSNTRPPGFTVLQNAGACAQRGHLLAKMLGGSGLDVRNIVTVTSLANNPHMSKWEKMVRDVWSKRYIGTSCNVEYEVRPTYVGGRDHPQDINIKATVVDPNDQFVRVLWFDVAIRNDPVPSTTSRFTRDIAAYRRSTGSLLDCTPRPAFCRKRQRPF